MKTTRTKILFISVLFSTAPSVLFSAEKLANVNNKIETYFLPKPDFLPLANAVYTDSLEKTKQLLLESNANINSQDKYGDIPLKCAVFNGNLDMIRLLLEHNATVDGQDEFGHTALYLAVFMGNSKIIQLLHENNADTNSKGKKGDTPLKLTEFMNNSKISKLLRTSEADAE